MPDYAKKALRGVAITFIMSFLASVTAYGLRIYLARTLGPRDLGLFYAVFTFIIFFLFFRGLGLGEALIKFIAEYHSRGEQGKIKSAIVAVTSLQMLSSVILGLAIFLAADFLALNYFKDPQAAGIIKWLIIYIFFSLLFIVMKSTFQGLQQMLLSSSMEFVKNLLVLLLAIIFFSLGFGVFSAVWAYCLACLILILGYLPFFLRSYNLLNYKLAEFWPVAKNISWFSLPLFATAVANKVIAYIDTLFLTYFRPLTEVGIYNVILPSALILLFFGTSIASIILPLSSELWAGREIGKLERGLHLLYKYTPMLVLLLLAPILVYSDFFISNLFGAEYSSGIPAFQILLIGVFFYSIATINNNFLSGIGRPGAVTVIFLVSALLNIILNLIFIPKYGLNGAAATTVASYLLSFVWSTIAVAKAINSKIPWKQWLVFLIPGGSLILFTFLLKINLSFHPAVEIVISLFGVGTIYAVLLYLFGCLDYKEVVQYYKVFRK